MNGLYQMMSDYLPGIPMANINIFHFWLPCVYNGVELRFLKARGGLSASKQRYDASKHNLIEIKMYQQKQVCFT